jgi:hypothetical protein
LSLERRGMQGELPDAAACEVVRLGQARSELALPPGKCPYASARIPVLLVVIGGATGN